MSSSLARIISAEAPAGRAPLARAQTRTALLPGEINGRVAGRTRLDRADLLRYRPAGTSIGPRGISLHPTGIRTELRPEDLSDHRGLKAASPLDEHQQLTKAAQRLVAQAFFGTLLKQMRNSPFKSEIFSGGRGGEAFTSMYDQYLAERMARGAGRSLSASIVKHLEQRAGTSVKSGTEVSGPANQADGAGGALP